MYLYISHTALMEHFFTSNYISIPLDFGGFFLICVGVCSFKYLIVFRSSSQRFEKKLYYRRKLNSYKRKYKGKDELNLQVFVANYGQKEVFPSFIFGSRQFFYYPRNYRHITPNNKGYIISFPGLKKLFNEKLIKKDLENMCTYYFKQKRGRQNSLDIKVKDEKTLNDGVFLNDGIVNFYLKIIEDEYTCGEGQANNVLVLKSFFYNSLSNQQNPDLSNNFCSAVVKLSTFLHIIE